MKKNILLLAVVLLSSGLQMAAKDRDLIAMRNFRELSSKIPYDSLTPNEKEQVFYMAFRSNLPKQRSAARDLINNKFKLSNQEWKELESKATNEGLNAVKTHFVAKSGGGSKAPSLAGGSAVPALPLAPGAKVAQQEITVLPQELIGLVDQLNNIMLEFRNLNDKDKITQGLLDYMNKIKDGVDLNTVIAKASNMIQKEINSQNMLLTNAKQDIIKYKEELKDLKVDNTEIEKIYFEGLKKGGVKQAARDLLDKVNELEKQKAQQQNQPPAPGSLANIPVHVLNP